MGDSEFISKGFEEMRDRAVKRFDGIGLAGVSGCSHEFGVMGWVKSSGYMHGTQFYCKRCLVRVSADELHFIGR